MRIAVVGVGGMGGYFGARLAQAGHEVSLVARGRNLEALRARGLTLRSHLAGQVSVRVAATDDPAAIGPVDLVLVCVKTYDLDAAAEQCRPLIGPDTVVLPTQNGIDAPERLSRVLGEERVLGGLAFVSATLVEPGVVVQPASPRVELTLGEMAGGWSERVERVRQAVAASGIVVESTDDVRRALWTKFVAICAGTLTAMARLPVGFILSCPETLGLYRGILEEGTALARASGMMLAEDTPDRIVAVVRGFAPDTRTSLANDLEGGRRLELESLNGMAVRLGRERGIPMPLNGAVYAALKPFLNGPPRVDAG